MPEPILCPECGHDINNHDLGECCDCPGSGRGCHQWVSDIARAYADESVRVAWQDGYKSAMLLTGPESSVAIEAAARALNLAGWTCFGGGHEPGYYDDCDLCRGLCDDMARTALRAAQEVRSHD